MELLSVRLAEAARAIRDADPRVECKVIACHHVAADGTGRALFAAKVRWPGCGTGPVGVQVEGDSPEDCARKAADFCRFRLAEREREAGAN